MRSMERQLRSLIFDNRQVSPRYDWTHFCSDWDGNQLRYFSSLEYRYPFLLITPFNWKFLYEE